MATDETMSLFTSGQDEIETIQHVVGDNLPKHRQHSSNIATYAPYKVVHVKYPL